MIHKRFSPLPSPSRATPTSHPTACRFIGHSLSDYTAFFNLNLATLAGSRLLDVGAGPSSFVAEARAAGLQVSAVDPLYTRSPNALSLLGQNDIESPCQHTSSPCTTDLRGRRTQALNLFLEDFVAGVPHQRYLAAHLPHLPFADGSFDLALSSHHLFLYAALHADTFVFEGCRELCRVAREVRIYPLTQVDGSLYPQLQRLRQQLHTTGINSSLEPIAYASAHSAAVHCLRLFQGEYR